MIKRVVKVSKRGLKIAKKFEAPSPASIEFGSLKDLVLLCLENATIYFGNYVNVILANGLLASILHSYLELMEFVVADEMLPDKFQYRLHASRHASGRKNRKHR